jgi:5'(3')-deoxyribonucleotidase
MKMKIRKCLLDVDGIVADWHKAIIKHHKKDLDWDDLPEGSIASTLGLTDQTLWKGCDRHFWENIEKTPDADKIVEVVRHFFIPKEICIVTMVPIHYGFPLEMTGECLLGKIKWLDNHFPGMSEQFFIGPNKDFASAPWSVLIDDATKVVDSFIEDGGNAILYPRPWNRLTELVNYNQGPDYLYNQLKGLIN